MARSANDRLAVEKMAKVRASNYSLEFIGDSNIII